MNGQKVCFVGWLFLQTALIGFPMAAFMLALTKTGLPGKRQHIVSEITVLLRLKFVGVGGKKLGLRGQPAADCNAILCS
ncbi:hypothetical protein SEEA9511_06708 [Salmonella enterica subsp. enterica serovar Agona str. 400095 11]|nr:hypothetical protein SEEA9511_06708 [Salmonella enterica subsp. enterica serovar Agona str. 400095 11]